MLNFAYGMQARSGIQCVARPAGRQPTEHIEIYTHFALHPGKLDVFKRDAAALLEVVKQKDTGTSRYDWFYDDANLTAVAADTYDDPASMFSHMRNCHEAHNKLLHHSTMVTEFLGTLPLAAMQAVAKYDPYIAPFLVGLRAYSSGGYA